MQNYSNTGKAIMFNFRSQLKDYIMDDKTKRGGQDRTRINTSEEYELRDWAEKFGVTPEELKEAVRASGSSEADTVEQFLKERSRN